MAAKYAREVRSRSLQNICTPQRFGVNPQRFADRGLAMLERVRRGIRCGSQDSRRAGVTCWSLVAALEVQGMTPNVPGPAGPIRGVDSPDPEKAESASARQKARKRMKTATLCAAQRRRKAIEEVIGWLKTVGGLARARWRAAGRSR